MRRIIRTMAQCSNHPLPQPVKRIGTHNGTFHCDEALACYMLKMLPECSSANIVRSRDVSVLNECDIIVDVGSVFNPASHRYDHHQRDFNESMHSLSSGRYPWVTKLSSAGLVYYHFGHRVVSIISSLPMDDPDLEVVYQKGYEQFMEEIDAHDNGISRTEGEPRFSISTTISNRVSYLVPAWNAANTDTDEIFPQAMELVGNEFSARIKSFIGIWLPAKKLVHEAFLRAVDIDPRGEIMLLTTACPWKDHLIDLESEHGIAGKFKYVLYPDGKVWRIQCVPIFLHGFENRKSLPEPWRGLRDDKLSDLAGIEGSTFVHASGFTGGNLTKAGVILMAKRALEFEEDCD